MRDARAITGGTRNAEAGLWPTWWATLDRPTKRAITASSSPVRMVDGKLVRLATDH